MAVFTNQATLTYRNFVTTSNIVSGTIIDVIDVTKTPVVNTYRQGETVTYVISIVNSGERDYTGLSVVDDLGAQPGDAAPMNYVDGSVKYYRNGQLIPTGLTITAGPPLRIDGVSVPSGGNAMIVYEAAINGYAPMNVGSSIVNDVTVSGAEIEPVTASATITPDPAPVLSIFKDLSPDVIDEGEPLTYTFTMNNIGTDPAAGVIVTDRFDPALTITGVMLNGAPFTDYTYVNGLFTANNMNVPGGAYIQNDEGMWTPEAGTAELTVTGTIA